MLAKGVDVKPLNRRMIAELARRVAETAVVTAAARKVSELEPGALYQHRATAPYDIEWAILEQRKTTSSQVYVVAADTLTLRGRYDVPVEPTATCGALSLRCASGAWLSSWVFRSEHRSGTLPSNAVKRARAVCRRVRQASSNCSLADPRDDALASGWDPDMYRDRLQQVTAAVQVLETLADARSAAGSVDWNVEAEDEISALYRMIARRAETLDPATAAEDPELSRAWAELRRLQTEEADRYQREFEASLAMPIDAGETLLARARELRRRFESPATDDQAT